MAKRFQLLGTLPRTDGTPGATAARPPAYSAKPHGLIGSLETLILVWPHQVNGQVNDPVPKYVEKEVTGYYLHIYSFNLVLQHSFWSPNTPFGLQQERCRTRSTVLILLNRPPAAAPSKRRNVESAYATVTFHVPLRVGVNQC